MLKNYLKANISNLLYYMVLLCDYIVSVQFGCIAM